MPGAALLLGQEAHDQEVGLTELLFLRRAAVACLIDEHNTIMVTWANFHYQDFVMNWVEHVQNVGVKSYLIGAMDDKLLEVGTRVLIVSNKP